MGHGQNQGVALKVDHSAAYARDLAHYRTAPFIAGIRIIAREDVECGRSAAVAGCYRLEDAPAWPPTGCDCEWGCLCWWEPIFDDEADGLTFKRPPA